MLGCLSSAPDPRVLVDMASSDDAGVVRFENGSVLIHTIDVITPIVDDPEDFGRIAAANAISDIYAMGGVPTSAVAFLGVPKAFPAPALGRIMQGAEGLLRQAGAFLVGGHTVKDQELKLGFAVTGTAQIEQLTTNTKALPKQKLILTKALGTGVLYQAMKKGLRKAKETRALIESMTALNSAARDRMVAAGVQAATDVTGFGLVGHALNIARGSDVDLVLWEPLPALVGVAGYLAAGVYPGTADINLKGYGRGLVVGQGVSEATVRLAADPQTSGGLLICAASEIADELCAQVNGWIVGEVRAKRGARPTVRLLRR